jgi:hypothetical protein
VVSESLGCNESERIGGLEIPTFSRVSIAGKVLLNPRHRVIGVSTVSSYSVFVYRLLVLGVFLYGTAVCRRFSFPFVPYAEPSSLLEMTRL